MEQTLPIIVDMKEGRGNTTSVRKKKPNNISMLLEDITKKKLPKASLRIKIWSDHTDRQSSVNCKISVTNSEDKAQTDGACKAYC